MISLLRLVMSKAIKSIASGAVKFQKPFLSNSHQWGSSKDSQVRVNPQEQKHRQGEAHAELPGQATMSAEPMAWIDDFGFLASQTTQTSPSTKPHAFHLVYSFLSPFLFCLLSAPKSSLCNWSESLLKSEKAAVISIFLVVLRVISGLLCYIFSCCFLYNNVQRVSDFFTEILSLMCL